VVSTNFGLKGVFPCTDEPYGLGSLCFVTFRYLSFLFVLWACLAGKVTPIEGLLVISVKLSLLVRAV
jgi:hypothetical protein